MNKETYERAKLMITEFKSDILTDAMITSGPRYDPTTGINGSLVLGGPSNAPRFLRGYREE